jgi:hypothetical protein
MFDLVKNKTLFAGKYHTHHEAIIVSCFFNPQQSSYRLKVFNQFYERIKHLNHLIIECVIGNGQPQLAETENIQRVYTKSLLWHKETLLNKAISQLPPQFKYIFWVDADVIFTNLDWLVTGVESLKSHQIIQPFEYCVHLDRDQLQPDFNLDQLRSDNLPNRRNSQVWRSFCANFVNTSLWQDQNYDNHGHVGFAWGARREVLEAVPLFDRALIGGADHIIAHAAAGQIPHPCIANSFTDNLAEVVAWSDRFYRVTQGDIGYVPGDLYHLWHGDINKRQYLKRIKDFTRVSNQITRRDRHGFFEADGDDDSYISDYFDLREVSDDDPVENNDEDNFLNSVVIGAATDSELLGAAIGGKMMGAILGDHLNDSIDSNQSNDSETFSSETFS